MTISIVEIPTVVTLDGAPSTQTVVIDVGVVGPQGTAGSTGATGPTGPVGPYGTLAVFSANGQLSVLTGTHRLFAERAATLTKVRASVGTAPVGAGVRVAYRLNGTKLGDVTIAGGANTAVVSTTQSVASGDYFTVDIEQVGSTTAGADLTVSLTLE